MPGVRAPAAAGRRARAADAGARPVRIPYRPLGRLRALNLHDRMVAAALPRMAGEIDLVHTWPLGALATLRGRAPARHPDRARAPERAHALRLRGRARGVRPARRPAAARPRARVQRGRSCVARRRSTSLPTGCSARRTFVVKTFLDLGFAAERLVRHFYGYDHELFHPPPQPRATATGLTVLFVGVARSARACTSRSRPGCARPPARRGRFLIAGEFLPEYEANARAAARAPERRGAGPPLRRPRADAQQPTCWCCRASRRAPRWSARGRRQRLRAARLRRVDRGRRHGVNALVHGVGDVETLARQFTTLHSDRARLEQLREGCRVSAPEFTWAKAGERLLEIYGERRRGAPRRRPRPRA